MSAIEDAARAQFDHDYSAHDQGWRDGVWHDMGGDPASEERLDYELAARVAFESIDVEAIARAICKSQNPDTPGAWDAYKDSWLRDAEAVKAHLLREDS